MKAVFAILVVVGVLVSAACGSSKKATSSNPAASSPSTAATTTSTNSTTPNPGALQAEAASAATGDIPDNQVYLVFRSTAGWRIKYPEGWAQSGSPNATVFRDKNNIARIVIRRGAGATPAQLRKDPSLRLARITSGPKAMNIKGRTAIKVVYTTRSAPNPVTGKRVTLTVDRYYLPRNGKVAIVDLGTPVGVDNVDAYRLMVESFRWR